MNKISPTRYIRKILVIRFRQIGDAVLTMSLCTTLRLSFPRAEIHLVLNKEIEPLFEGHPDIDRIISFDHHNKQFGQYVNRVWQVMSNTKYDVIIDMRATFKSLFFPALSRRTHYRIGRGKWYSRPFLTHHITEETVKQMPMLEQNLMFASPLEDETLIQYCTDFKLSLHPGEVDRLRDHLASLGIDFNRPIVLLGASAKLVSKRWNKRFMTIIVGRMLDAYPDAQFILNHAHGEEETETRDMYEALRMPRRLLTMLRPTSLRELAALCSLSAFYFGNEGGTRHIAHSFGVPSFVIVSPRTSKDVWLPRNHVPAEWISCEDILSYTQLKSMTEQERYDAITPDIVWSKLNPMLSEYCGASVDAYLPTGTRCNPTCKLLPA
jgi:ADP-heptose:LPS heptosyltransferase